MPERQGPSIKIELSCMGCRFHEQERFQVQGDSGYNQYCHAAGERRSLGQPYTGPTPDDSCPYLPASFHVEFIEGVFMKASDNDGQN